MSASEILEVRLHGAPIGTIANLGRDRTVFAFNEDYIGNSERPTLGLWFKHSPTDLSRGFRPVQRRVMPFFANLLPEGQLRDYLARTIGENPDREFRFLASLGRDLPGAVSIHPLGDWYLGEDADDRRMRFSLSGVQMKLSVRVSDDGRFTIPTLGVGGDWIVKLPSQNFPGLVGNEFSMMTLARLVGIDVPVFTLRPVAEIGALPIGIAMDGEAFAIRRFDRRADGSQVHVEDFAQVFGVYPERKYDKARMLRILKILTKEATETDVVELIRRIVFSVMIGNGDMHLKNWALIYPDGRSPRLAPAYDFVSTLPYIGNEKLALKVSRTNVFSEVDDNELAHLAIHGGAPKRLVLETARETAASFRQHWHAERTNLPLAPAAREAIDAHLLNIQAY